MIDFKFADIGEGIHEGVILKWLFEEGDKVNEGDTIVVIETDKVNAEIPSPENGTLIKQGAKVGETIHVGETLAIIGDPSEKAPKEDAKEAPKEEKKTESKGESGASVVGSVEVSDELMPSSDEHSSASEDAQSNKKVLATPVARKLASDLGVDITSLKGSGPNGRIMKSDIEAASSDAPKAASTDAPKASASAPSVSVSMPSFNDRPVRREKISSLRKAVVNAMNISNQVIPATTVMDEFDVTKLVEFRNQQKNLAKDNDAKLTYLPLILKAIVLALKQHPIFNASFDHAAEEIIYKDYFNLGIAVDTPSGLVVPNIKGADRLSIFDLAKEVDRVATLAREKKLQLSDLSDTTFSITNYGALGSSLGTPVIKHPEVAILGMGAITQKPWVVDGEIVARYTFPVSLTIDHRVIDGADAGRFIQVLKKYLSEPMLLLLS